MACQWPELLEPDADAGTVYVAALYWAFAAMSTVGYGDLVPTTEAEMVVTLIIEFVGVVFFGYVVATVTSLTSKSSRREVSR